MKSDLGPTLPTEATDPAICGVLAAAPTGGMDTGAGGTSNPDTNGKILLGGGLRLAAAGAGTATARLARKTA